MTENSSQEEESPDTSIIPTSPTGVQAVETGGVTEAGRGQEPPSDNDQNATSPEAREKWLQKALKKKPTKESGGNALPIGKIDTQDLRRVSQLFVPSSDFLNWLESRSSQPDYNLWIIHGLEHTGKLTTALNLALRLLNCEPDEEKVYCYRRAATDSLALIDLVRHEDFKPGKACLLEDAFDRNVSLQDLSPLWLDSLDRTLKDKHAFLILTTRWEPHHLEPLNVGKISAFPHDLQQVFERHLDRFAEHVEAVDPLDEVLRTVRSRWTLISNYLKKPAQINRFCHKLGDLRGKVTDQVLETLAREAAYLGETSAHRIFGELGDNQKLYALLVILFEGLERADLEEIYTLAVQHLREEGVSTLRDEREIGLDDILDQIRARESETRQVVIENTELREEVSCQVRNHRLLLYTLSMRLLALCEEYSDPRYWEVRRAIGRAIGRLGAQQKRGLDPISGILDALADHQNGSIASVPGFIFDQMCRDAPQLRSDVLAYLNAWVESGDADRMWAAGAAAWRIYEGMGEGRDPSLGQKDPASWQHRTLDVLSGLIRKAAQLSSDAWSQENLLCASFALIQILKASPLSTVGKLAGWLRGKPGEPVREIAHFACRQVLEQAALETGVPFPQDQAWLELIEPILALEPDIVEAGDALMAALANGSRWRGSGEDPVYEQLLKAANRLSGHAARSLRAGLIQYWLTSDSEPVRLRGRILLRRSHAMEGLPLRDLLPVRGLVALDASPEALAVSGSSRFSCQLIQTISCYADVAVGHLGGTEIPIQPQKGWAEKDLRPAFPHPRLLLPLAQEKPESPADPRIVLALTWGSILDLEDGRDQCWWPPLLVTAGGWSQSATTGRPAELAGDPLPPRPVTLTPSLDEVVLAIVRALNARFSGDDQEPPFREMTPQEMEALDQATGTQEAPDPAARMITALLRLATTDFAGCLQILRNWIDAPVAGELSLRAASAGLRALLRFHAEPGQSLVDGDKEALLRLSLSLPLSDEGAAETVLETVFAWMSESSWAERIASGSGLSLVWMRWFETLIPYQARALDRWLSNREREAPQENESATVRQALSWLRFRLSLGASGSLPALEDGRKYGLILLDAFNEGLASREGLAQLTADLLEHSQLQSIPCLVFRLGRKIPLAVPGEKLAKDAVLPKVGARLSRILGPILEALPPERILFALVLAAGPAIDAADWSEDPWASRIRLYGPTELSNFAEPFIRISRLQSDETREADALLRNLKPLIEQGA